MAVVLNGSTQYARITSLTSAITKPATVACWVRTDSAAPVSANEYFYTIKENGGSGNTGVGAAFRTSGTNVGAFEEGATTFNLVAPASPNYASDTWTLVLVILTSNTSRRCVHRGDWANSASSSTDTGAIVLDEIILGALEDSNDASPTNFWDGAIAGFCVWDVAFTEANSDSLWNSGTPIAPNTVRPSDVVQYNELYNSVTAATGDDFVLTGSPTFDTADHPYAVDTGNPRYYYAQQQ